MLIILFTILDLEGWQHVMAKRQYEEVEAGPQSTNRFIQKPTIPTTVVTGATTAPAKVQPNLTGKRKPVEVNQDSAGGSPVGDPTPVDFASLTNQELSNMANSGFAGGWTGPGSITSSIASTLGFGLVTAIGRGANMYGARQEIKARLTTPGLRTGEEDLIVNTPMSSKETAREMKQLNQKVTLADRGYGEGGDGQGDAVGAHPVTDDLGPDSGQGDTEATWGG